MPDMSTNTVLARIRARREYLGLNQIDVAEALGISRPSYTSKELGNQALTVDELLTIAKILRVHPSHFFGDEAESETTEEEMEMLRLFRDLSPELRRALTGAAKGMLDG